MLRSAKIRVLAACCALAAFFTVFSARLVYLQVRRHEEFATLANDKHVNKLAILARRGVIEDINYERLAENDPICTVVADGTRMKHPEEIAEVLAGPLGLDEAALREKLTTARRYVVIKKQVPQAVTGELENRLGVRSLCGVTFEPDAARIYPNGSMLCHVIGFLNSDHEGVEGIERQMDEYLRGQDGFRFIERDRTGKELVAYRGQERAPRDGCNVRLTVDLNLQNIVETELDAACAQYRPQESHRHPDAPEHRRNPRAREPPEFRPERHPHPARELCHRAGGEDEELRDHGRNGAGLDVQDRHRLRRVERETRACPTRSSFARTAIFPTAASPARSPPAIADLTVDDILVKSSNIGAAKLAMQLGEQRFYEYIRQFWFRRAYRRQLCRARSAGRSYPPNKWSKISITHIPMGQEVAVTPLQTHLRDGAIANGGHLMMPQIVHEIADDAGNAVIQFPAGAGAAGRQPGGRDGSRARRCKGVVSPRRHGAAGARCPGYPVAGKTGTAEKIDPKPTAAICRANTSFPFADFCPAENPAFVGIVMLDEAR